MVRVAAALHVFLGLAFGLSVPFVLRHFGEHGELPMSPVGGFRQLAGPFESFGTELFTLLGWSLVLVSAVDVAAGWLLWQRRRSGLVLSLITALPALVLGYGFALPLLLFGVPLRTLVALDGRSDLR